MVMNPSIENTFNNNNKNYYEGLSNAELVRFDDEYLFRKKEEHIFFEECQKRTLSRLEKKKDYIESLESINLTEPIEGAWKLRYNMKDNNFIVHDKDDKKTKKRITLDEISVELSLGNKFFFENLTDEMKEKCRKALISYEEDWINDYQETQTYFKRAQEEQNKGKMYSYMKLLVRSPELEKDSESVGFLLERMVQNMLTRHLAKKPGKGIRIESATIAEDIESKIDFKIHLTENFYDGISTDYLDSKSLDVQLTQNPDNYNKKLRQAERSRDDGKTLSGIYVLALKLENHEIMEAYHAWEKNGRPIGGPEQFLRDDIKDKIIDLLVKHTEDRLKELKNSPTAGSIIA